MLFSKLTHEEQRMIDAYTYSYTYHDLYSVYDNPRASLNWILREWNSKKAFLFKMFNENLILKKEVKYELSENEIEKMIEDILYNEEGPQTTREAFLDFKENLRNWLEEQSQNEKLSLEKYVHNSAVIEYCFSPFNLAANEWSGMKREFFIPDLDKIITVQKGMKITKILRKIAEATGVKGYEDFRIEHSMILNKKTIKGTLCLSIHPLDFMTMSDNYSDWSSCMSWVEEGCYRQGTVEMMNSKYVVVAYLESSRPMILEDGEWNNKKWRELFIVDQDFISGIKGYPYHNEELEKEVITWLAELHPRNDFYPDFFLVENNIPFQTPDGETKLYFYTYNMYNDLKRSGNLALTMIRKNPDPYYHCVYSGLGECLWCGDLVAEQEIREDSLICRYCQDGYECCAICGERIVNNDPSGHFMVSNNCVYCDYCFQENAEWCSFSYAYHLREDMYPIYLRDTYEDKNNLKTIYIAKECLYYYDEDYFKDWFLNGKFFTDEEGNYFVTLNDLAPRGRLLFNIS